MKIKDLDFKKYDKSFFGDWIEMCIFNGAEKYQKDQSYRKELYSVIRKSKDTEDFIDKYIACENFKCRQAYAALIKNCRQSKLFYAIRDMVGDKQFKTSSDAGGVKIGNNGFSVIVPNGRGDGVTRVGILEQEEFNQNLLHFFTGVEGEINIYAYDCGDTIAKTISGRFGVYYGEGFVVFEKWGD